MGLNHSVQANLLSNSRYKKLLDEHTELKREIKHQGSLPAIDTTKLRTLKKRKLFLVDQMTMIERGAS